MNDNEEFWRAIVMGDAGVMRRERRRHRRIPGAPRCKTCLVPLGGPAAPLVRLVLNRRPSSMNPNYCDTCDRFVGTHPGGAEVEISMLFADVRGSTALAEQMPPTEFSRLLNRFSPAWRWDHPVAPVVPRDREGRDVAGRGASRLDAGYVVSGKFDGVVGIARSTCTGPPCLTRVTTGRPRACRCGIPSCGRRRARSRPVASART